jgi:ketosteroid isomerase-like protein
LHHDVSADGRDGFTYGYFDVIRPAGDTLPGRYHAYWRRDASDAWRILVFQRGRREAGPLTVVLPFPARTLAWGPSASGDSLRTQDELRRMEAAFNDSAALSLDGAFKHFAAPDAGKFAPPSRFVFGPEGIETIFTGAPPGAGPAWRPEAVSVARSNDLGFTYGPAWPRQGPAPRDAEVRGRYFTIWRRQPDGTWKYVVD